MMNSYLVRDATTGRYVSLLTDPILRRQRKLEVARRNGRKYYWNNRPKVLARVKELKYGVSEQFIERLTVIQEGKCGICKKPIKLYTDHEHKKKIVRGLLCNHCNLKLALIENKVWLLRVFKYLGMEAIDLW